MAIDRLINSTQGDSIIAALNAISSKVGSPYNLENKLNPAYINYDSTHAAVTDAEKTTWSEKQNALTFDGAYSASTNKAATVSTVTNAINALDVTGASGISAAKTISAWSETDGKVSVSTQDIAITGTQAVLTGYQKSTTAGQAVAATDNVNQAIGKVEKRVSDNENNISSVNDHYKYYNRTLFEQESIPTGTIAYGSTWIDGKAVRTYNQTTNIVGGVIEQGSWNATNIVKTDSTTRCRLSNSITVKPSTTYTIRLVSPTINNARLLLQYRDSNDYTSSESGWQTTLPYTFTTPSNCHKATIILSTVGDLICTPIDFGNLQINEGDTALSYEVPSWSTTDSEIITYNANNGVKNTFDFANAPQESNIYTTVVKTATSLKVTANNPGAGSSSVVYSGKNYPAGDYIFSCKITDYSCTTQTAKIYIATSTAAGTGVANKTITGNGTIQIPFYWNGGKVYVKYFPNESNTLNQSNTFTASENMIMLASISDTSYQPYALSNAELTANVLYNTDNGVKNILDFANMSKVGGSATVVKDDYSIAVTSIAASWSSVAYTLPILPAGTYTFSALVSNYNVSGGAARIIVTKTIGGQQEVGGKTLDANGRINFNFVSDGEQLYLLYYPNYSTGSYVNSFTALQNMLCTKATWDISQTYQPYALPNAELTENVLWNTNHSVKNLCKPNVSADSEVTYTVNADNSITVTCNTTAIRDVHIFTDLSGLTDGKDYILSGCSGGDYSNTYGFAVRTSSSVGKAFESDGETTFTKTAEIVKMDLIIRSGQNWTKTFYPMIRPAYISDPTYQPYALSNAELTALADLAVPTIPSTTTLASYAGTLAKGYHTAFIVNGQNPSDSPVSDNCFVDFFVYSANTAQMRVYPTYSTYAGEFYVRTKVSGSWGSWYKFQGTAVTP